MIQYRWTLGIWLKLGILLFWISFSVHGFPDFFGNWGRQHSTIICNPNTSFSCFCEDCWTSSSSSPFPASEEANWIAVEFQKCPLLNEASEAAGREKLSQWLIEECAFVLDCSKFNLQNFTFQNILLGGFECPEKKGKNKNGILYLTALKNASNIFETDNIIPPSMLGSVVQAREHLFSSIFQADLDSVTLIEKRFSQKGGVQIKKNNKFVFLISETPLMLASIAFASLLLSFILTFILICFFTLCCISRIQWSRFASTKWIYGTKKQSKIKLKNNIDHELYMLQKSDTTKGREEEKLPNKFIS